MTKPSKRPERRSGYLPGTGEMPLPSGGVELPKEAPSPSHEEPGAKAARAAREETTEASAALQRFLVRLLCRMAGEHQQASAELLDAAAKRRLL